MTWGMYRYNAIVICSHVGVVMGCMIRVLGLKTQFRTQHSKFTAKAVAEACVSLCWLWQAGISCADRVVTVSPGYAWEIQTPEGGWGMEGMLASRSYALNGVLNGVDLVEWDPDNDPHIYQNFSNTNFTRGKQVNKAGLQKEMGLPQRPEVCSPLTPSYRLRFVKQLNCIVGTIQGITAF